MASKELLLKVLDANGKEIENLGTPTAANSATYTELAATPANVGTAAPGTSFIAAAQDHVHEGVHGVGANGGAVATGDINLVDGTGIAITRVGQNVTISASPTSLNKITLAHDGAAYAIGTSEEIIREYYVNFDDAAGANIKVMLAAIVKITNALSTGTFNVRVGATAPGATTGSTVHATFDSTSLTEELKENLGSSFANPGGQKLVQITAVSDTALARAYIRGLQVTIG